MKKHHKSRVRRTAHRHASKLLSSAGAALAAVAVIGVFALALLLVSPSFRTGQMAAVISGVLVDLTNKDRQQEELGTLTVNPLLVAAAKAKAEDMAEKSYFAHVSPDGRDSWTWFREAGYSFSYAGENLAVDFSDSVDVEEAWMNSPTHRANIMNGKFTEIGIATAVGTYKGHKVTFVVQMFGTPKALAAAAAPVRAITQAPGSTDIAVATTEKTDTTVLGASEAPAPDTVKKTKPAAVVSLAEQAPVIASAESAPHAPLWGKLVTSPRTLLHMVYLLFALLLLVALLTITGLELRKHHVRHVAFAMLLLVLMGGLSVVGERVVFTNPTIDVAYASD